MEKTIKSGQKINKALCAVLVCMSAIFFSCSKPDDPGPVVPLPPVTPPPSSTASGIIDTFYVNDTLIPYNTGTTAKWNVTGTNSLTIVTFNGVKVAFNGVLDTGPLTFGTAFTLAVNSGKMVTRFVHVADSLTTNLWNTGKQLRLTKTEYNVTLVGVPGGAQWRDTTLSIQSPSQRMVFGIDSTVSIIQSMPVYVATKSGKFIANSTQWSYDWKGITYIIGARTDKMLQVTYIMRQLNGVVNQVRDTYVYE